MSKLLTIILTYICVFISSCIVNFDGGVIGNGNVVIKERPVEPFNELKAERGLHVFVEQGDEYKCVVEADENLQDIIVTKVDGNTLKITSRENIKEAEEKNIYVSLVDINSIKVSSAAVLEGQTIIASESLHISSSSAASVTLDINSEEISADASSAGNLKISGKCINFYGEASSAGVIKAKSLTTQHSKITASSAGSVGVFAYETIKLSASSGGNISYWGNARVLSTSVSSGGQVHQKD